MGFLSIFLSLDTSKATETDQSPVNFLKGGAKTL